MGFFANLLGVAKTVGGKPFVGKIAKGMSHALSPGAIAFQAGMGIVLPMVLTQGGTKDKLHAGGIGALTFAMTMGMGSILKQGVWNSAFMAIPAMPGMYRSLVQTYRSGLEARTSAAVPFSHSNLPMEQAYAAISYASHSISGMPGNEAAYAAARYMSRG